MNLDRSENEKARTRAKGRCETRLELEIDGAYAYKIYRCRRRDVETHHLIGGFGRRGRNESALAINKLRCCRPCHLAITTHVFVPVDRQANAGSMVYRTARRRLVV